MKPNRKPDKPDTRNPTKPKRNMVYNGPGNRTRGLARFWGLGPNPNRTEPMPTPTTHCLHLMKTDWLAEIIFSMMWAKREVKTLAINLYIKPKNEMGRNPLEGRDSQP
jgi:hypothetical protein